MSQHHPDPDATRSTAAAGRFERDTAVRPVGPGRYRGRLDAGWAVIGDAAPNGGYVMALAARAMRDPLPHPDPVSITAHYLAPPEHGDVDVEIDVIRTGRHHSTATGRLVQDGVEKVRLLGTFGDLAARADGPTRVDRRPPDLPPVGDCLDVGAEADARGFPTPPILRRFDHRVPERLTSWAVGRPTGRGEMGGYLRWADAAPMDTLGLLVVADCYPPAVFNAGDLPLGWVPTIELTVQVRRQPGPGYLRAWMRTEAVTSGYLEEDGEIWDADGNLVALSRQLALAARATE